eukprot:TRINITY_DN14262_c0_g1_i1.p2 TRINITY_DN14262_c0_g1~~TRINITY_DN14262_c0_g1_i1.p2  ORF type:complete len:183 (-),score=45.02 TRINITY_DN14262_c0_g1_i1:83-631(-)
MAERYYSTTYFFETNYRALRESFGFAASKKRPTYFNLGSANWVKKYSKELIGILPLIEGVIGNVEEVAELGRCLAGKNLALEESIERICKHEGNNRRFIVATNATEPTLTGELRAGKVRISEMATPKAQSVKNTNGAGDTLAGGVLGGLIAGLDLKAAVEVGQKLALYYVQQADGSLPANVL